MNRVSNLNTDYSHFVEVHPTGRYGRHEEVVGRSDSKTIYRAFDEHQGIEVAWNQVMSSDIAQSTEDLQRMYSKIRQAKLFKHKNILKFYTSWVDTATKNINFVTEMFNSTLRQHRLKHKRFSVWTVKHWCRQILRGLVYLHSHDPPVIHNDLRSDNIFINGAEGKLKIGYFGLSGIVQSASFVGTLEFMAPEVHEETYNELADIYSFGMCILEMVTSEIPYSECSHPFEFFKKLKSGEKPADLYRVNDREIRQFLDKCLAPVSLRLSAMELLNDPFLQIGDVKSDSRPLDYSRKVNDTFGTLMRQPQLDFHSISNGDGNGAKDFLGKESSGSEDFDYYDHQHLANIDVSVKAKWINGIAVMRLEAADGKNRAQKDCPYGLETERALSVATELVAELESNLQDVTKTADMIKAAKSFIELEWIRQTTRYSQRQLQWLENTNYERYNLVGARPSERNVMATRKPQDSITNNPLGVKASFSSVLAKKLPVLNQLASSHFGNNPTIY